jgi:hypothetical protein
MLRKTTATSKGRRPPVTFGAEDDLSLSLHAETKTSLEKERSQSVYTVGSVMNKRITA